MAEIKVALAAAAQRLTGLTSTPPLDAQVLMAHILSRPKTWVMAHPEERLNPEEEGAFQTALERLQQGEPLAYILGHWEFYGLDFEVDHHVLIPRPETELLVEEAIKWLHAHPGRRRAVDVGTGSGCIAVALAKQFSDLRIAAVDQSAAALQVARRNAARHGVEAQIDIKQGDLLGAVLGPFDLICANLPYIPNRTLDGLAVARYEPRLALDGGPDGLESIRRLFSLLPRYLAPGGLLLAEIEYRQGAAVLELAAAVLPAARQQVIPDLAGNNRLLILERTTCTLLLPSSDPVALQSAVQVIRQGRLVAFPTDTVYGLAADAFRAECIELLFEVKGRDMAKAIPVLVGDPAQLAQVAVEVSPAALRLAQHFWPGPLTLVVPRHPSLPEVLSPLPTVGVRMPDHPLALELLRRTGPLATTSANLSGAANPLTAQDVYSQLDGRIDLILDGGATPGGVPSTVVDCTTPTPTILRQGPITLKMINSALKDQK